MSVEAITLYRAPTTVCDVEEIASWLRERLTADIIVEGRFLDEVSDPEALATTFADARVLRPFDRQTGSQMHGIIRYEERVLADPARGGGVMYDGHQVQRALNQALSPEERSLSHLHVVFLDRVIGTWGTHDGRWHKRIAVLGQPALISVPGLWEAPAKPEEYYQQQGAAAMLSGDVPPSEVLESTLATDLLVQEDPRTTEALKGYVLAALHLLDTGEGFCDDPACRLTNPHRHEGVIAAQFSDPSFCDKHAAQYG